MRNGNFALQHGGCPVTLARTPAAGPNAVPDPAACIENVSSSIIPGPQRSAPDAAFSLSASSVVNVRELRRGFDVMPAGSYLNF
jgi:hypothetical protein